MPGVVSREDIKADDSSPRLGRLALEEQLHALTGRDIMVMTGAEANGYADVAFGAASKDTPELVLVVTLTVTSTKDGEAGAAAPKGVVPKLLGGIVLCVAVGAAAGVIVGAAVGAFAPTAPLALRSKSAAIATGLKRPVRTTAVAPKMSLLDQGSSLLLAGEGMAVSSAAYIAVLLGTFIPVVFLVTLYIQSEARKAAESGSEGDKF